MIQLQNKYKIGDIFKTGLSSLNLRIPKGTTFSIIDIVTGEFPYVVKFKGYGVYNMNSEDVETLRQ